MQMFVFEKKKRNEYVCIWKKKSN